jgi:DNA modification methylase
MGQYEKQYPGVFYMRRKDDLGLQGFELHHGDCLDVMKNIPDKSVDMILADPP